MNPEVAKVLKSRHYPLEVMLNCVRWYVVYPLSPRHLEAMLAGRGISVDHSIVHRWAPKLLPALNRIFRRQKRPVSKSWRMDETYMQVRGKWKYLVGPEQSRKARRSKALREEADIRNCKDEAYWHTESCKFRRGLNGPNADHAADWRVVQAAAG